MSERYLSDRGKRRELAAWRRARRIRVPAGENAGRGFPDPDVIPWCDELNAIPGVCTLQSCSGHAPASPSADPHPGHVWLWLDEDLSRAFDGSAFRLANQTNLIDRVARLYTAWGQEVVAITFAGNERRKLDQAMGLIASFLRSLREQLPTGDFPEPEKAP